MRLFSISIPGFTITGKAWGNPKLPPMLALHGWLDNANSFDPIAPYLEKQFHLIAIDLPGHGLSSHLPSGCHYHFIDGVFAIIAVIKALSLEKLHLLGHSMGACLASLVAGVIPDHFLSVALIEGLGPFSSPEESCRNQLAHYAASETSFKENKIKRYSSQALTAEARAKSGHLPLELARILCERGVKEEEGKFYWSHDRRLTTPTPLRMTEGQIFSCLSAISASTCLIEAKEGFKFNEELMQQRKAAVPHLESYLMEGGHHIHMEQPKETANLLQQFWGTL